MLKAMIDPKYAKVAAVNLWRTVAIGSVALWALVVFNDSIARTITGQKPENHLRIESVYFRDGAFHQKIVPTASEPRQADWSASIFYGPVFVCGGGGNGTYLQRTRPAVFSANDWTGDECHDAPHALTPGLEYQAYATWRYLTSDGAPHELSVQFSFVYEEAPE